MSDATSRPESRDILIALVQEPDVRRRELLAQIETVTGRHAINYSATAYGASGEILQNADIVNLTRVFRHEAGLTGIDLILNSPGGQPEAAEKVIMTLRHFFNDDFRVIVPETAKSAATIVALGADEIVMGYCSELGPIDPQMFVPDEHGRGVFRSAHAIIQSVDAYVEKMHAAIKAKEPFEGFLRLLDFRPDLAFVEECRLAHKLSQEIATRWLKQKMLRADQAKAERTAQALSRADRLFSHGRSIDHLYAKDELGLNVKYVAPDDPLWKLIWELHLRTHWTLLQNRLVKIIESCTNTLAFNS